jgi:predicted secreted protein
MTGAIKGAVAALYVSDPTVAPATFSQVAMVDQGDHLAYVAPYGNRWWSNDTLLVELQVHGAGGWSDVTALVTRQNRPLGLVAFSVVKNADDKIRVSGKKFSAVKAAEVYKWRLEKDKKFLDVTSMDSGLWDEYIAGVKNWKVTASRWVFDPVLWSHYIQDVGQTYIPGMIILYSRDTTDKDNWAGLGQVQSYNVNAAIKDPQSEEVVFMGQGAIAVEANH